MEYKAPPTPYGGIYKNHPAETGPHLLVSGPSGVGKSRRVLAPGIRIWDGPVVAVSSKPDLVELCLEGRRYDGGGGRTYVLDLSGEVPDRMLPAGVERVVLDPTQLLENDDDATDMATVLMQAGSVGGGGGTTKSGDSFWETVSTGPLAGILRAAGADGVAWAREAVENVGKLDEDGEITDEPSWMTAIERLEAMDSIYAKQLASAVEREDKMRDSVMITMLAALAPWGRSTVRASRGERAFVPSMLEHPRATLFVIAPATGVAAGAAVACVDVISKRWRANQTEEVRLPRLLMVVDELTNTMPWPKLPTVVTEARAMGIHLLVAVQATSQLAKRYGSEGMTELRQVFPSVLLLVGAAEKEMLEDAAWAYGKVDRSRSTVDHRGRQSHSVDTSDVMTGADLLPRSMDHGRLLRGKPHGDTSPRMDPAGVRVDLLDFSQMRFA